MAKDFWASVNKTETCWLRGNKTDCYTTFRMRPAHRYSYELVNGPIPKGRIIHHTCQVKSCVNPKHLVAVTPGQHADAHAGCRECKKPFPKFVRGKQYCDSFCRMQAAGKLRSFDMAMFRMAVKDLRYLARRGRIPRMEKISARLAIAHLEA